MNYMYLHLAGKWASEQGADEAIITNGDIKDSNDCIFDNLKKRCLELIKNRVSACNSP